MTASRGAETSAEGEEPPRSREERRGEDRGGEQDATREPEGDEAERASRADRVGPVLRAMSLGILVILGACVGGGLIRWGLSLFEHEREPPAEVVEVRATPNVVTAVRDLARLEGASYHMERVIDLSSRQRRVFGLVEAEDTILLVAAADVVAGVDLASMRDGDVVIEPDAHRAEITLPAVRILSARLDNDRTYVHHRETDLLARRRETLETQARQQAERDLAQSAIEAGILQRAEQNVARTVEALVRSLGYDEVRVRFEADSATELEADVQR